MSLDVYLRMSGVQAAHSGSGIFIRENGQNREISRAEWDERFPGREPVMAPEEPVDDEVYSANITHNLNRMANEAGIYKHLWRPEELDITRATQLIEPLRAGLATLKSDPAHFKQFNPPNRWGNYGGLVRFVEDYLAACEQYPDAEVSVSR
jgi:hypothetical protein